MGASACSLEERRNENSEVIGPQPVTNPWIIIPIIFEIIQYRASPLGNCNVNTPNMMGSIQSIIRLVDSCFGSAEGRVLIFCMSHMDTPTRMGNSG